VLVYHSLCSSVLTICSAAIRALSDANTAMRDLAALVTGALAFQFGGMDADSSSSCLAPHTQQCLAAVIEVLRGDSPLVHSAPRDVRDAVQDALLALLPALSAHVCMETALGWLRGGHGMGGASGSGGSASGSSAGASGSELEATILPLLALKMLARLIALASTPAVMQRCEPLCDALCAAMRAPNADVRKCAVFALVEVFAHAQDALTPALQARLNTSEMRLVTIYITKSVEAKVRQQQQQQQQQQ
jgi:hypothetical protein